MLSIDLATRHHRGLKYNRIPGHAFPDQFYDIMMPKKFLKTRAFDDAYLFQN
jgi:hypothetical protein